MDRKIADRHPVQIDRYTQGDIKPIWSINVGREHLHTVARIHQRPGQTVTRADRTAVAHGGQVVGGVE